MVKIRLSRTGKKHAPFFRIVAVDARNKRDGACLEILGTYDGLHSKVVRLDEERVKAWVSQGAAMTDTVRKIYKMYKNHARLATVPS